MNDPFDDAVGHHLTIERFAATDIRTNSDEHWRIARIRVDRHDCTFVELMFRIGDDSTENRFQMWRGIDSCAIDGIVDGLVQIRLDDRSLRIALDSRHGADLGLLSNLLTFELPSDTEARAALEDILIWAHDQNRWDIRLPSMQRSPEAI